jgi:integrase
LPRPATVADRVEKLVVSREPAEHLFLSPDGHPINSGNWRKRVVYPACAAVGIRGMHPHDLRHTTGSLAISPGPT